VKRKLAASLVLLLAGASLLLAKELTVTALETEFKAECAALNKQRMPGTGETIIGKDSWLVLGTELDYLINGPFWGPDAARSNPNKPGADDPLAAILDYDAQLKRHGIELIVMPVPTRVLVFPEAVLGKEKLPKGTPPRLHTPELQFYRLLRSKGVNVLDLMPVFLAERSSQYGTVFVPSESHWTGYGVALAAREVAKEIKSQHWAKKVPKHEFTAVWNSREINGHILKSAQEAGDKTLKPDTVWTRVIQEKTAKGPQPIAQSQPDSPVVIIGDSNAFWWSLQGGGLPEELSYELGFPVEIVPTAQGGATNSRISLMRRIHSDPTYLAKKKVVLWCFTSRGFVHTGDGWSLVPLEGVPPETPTPAPK
jgi:hypothetical protein